MDNFGVRRQSGSGDGAFGRTWRVVKLKAPNTKDEKFEDVVKSAQNAAVLVLVY